jgi:CHAT domain-containing protein/tetratricopeptide (TPR) repeat protein
MLQQRFFLRVLTYAAVSLAIVLPQAFSQEEVPTLDEAILRELTTRFYYDFEKLDLEDQLAMWSPRSQDDSSKRANETRFFAILDKPKVEKFEIKQIVVNGDEASVRLIVNVSALNKKDGKPLRGWLNHDVDLTHKLVREDGRWLLMEQADTLFIEQQAAAKRFELVADKFVAAKTDEERQRILGEGWDGKDAALLNAIGEKADEFARRDHDYEKAVELLKFATKLAETAGDRNSMKFFAQLLAGNSTMLGDHGLALLADERYLQLATEENSAGEIANAWNSIGGDYFVLGDTQRSLEAYKKAIAMVVPTRPPEGSPMLTGNLGAASLDLGDYATAREAFQKLLDMSQKAKVETPSKKNEAERNTARAYWGLADVAHAEGNLQEAREYYEKSRQLLLQSSFRKGDLNGLLKNYAVNSLELGDYGASIEQASQAVNGALEINVPDLAWDAQVTEAIAYRKLGKTDEAIKLLQQAVATIEAMRTRAIGDESTQEVFFRNKSTPYEELADIYATLGDKENALLYAERGRARVLDTVMSGGRARVEKSMSHAEVEQERKLKNDISAANLELGHEFQMPKRDEHRLPILQRKLDEARTQYESFETTLYARYPMLRSIRGDAQVASTKDLSALLEDSSTAVLEFLVLSDKVVTFVARKSPGGVSVHLSTRDISNKLLADQVAKLQSKIAKGDLTFPADSRQLYDLLVRPVSPILTGAKRLVIIPDGPLWNLPFQALMDENGKYLAEKMAVSYAPSLTALREMQKKARERTPSKDAELVAFGNPTVAAETEKRVGQVFMDEKLEPLPEAERLVNTLAKMYGPQRSRIYTGAAAREEMAKQEAPKYRIVQFATHGILNDISPMYSHLVLAQDEKDPNEDGLLEAWELKDLDLKADMVILSACDTARGKISNGEGIIGMTWAAFIAGAPTTVASQWKVESSSTTELMLEFHRQLLSGKVSKAEALRRAQLKLMRNPKYKHPSYGAAWVFVGDAS